MDWLPEWVQITVSVAGAVTIALGFYWRLIVRINKLEQDMETAQTETEYVKGKLLKLDAKSEARDAELKDHGVKLTRIETALDIHIPQLLDGLKNLSETVTRAIK